MAKSNYLKNAILDHQLGGPDYVRPSTIYLGLYTSPPSGGGGGTEVSGGSYARVPLTNNLTNFPASVGGSKSNGVVINFSPSPTASWGLVTHFGLFDALTSGNLLRYGALTVAKQIATSDTVTFPIGELIMIEG